MGETSLNGRIITAVFRLVNYFNLAININIYIYYIYIYTYDDLCVIYDDIWMNKALTNWGCYH